MNSRYKLVVITILVAISGFAAVGCGVSEPDSSSSGSGETDTPTPQYITTEEIEKTPVDSPERATLEFWSAIQNQRMPDAFDKLAPDYQDQAKNVDNFAKFIMADYAHWLVNPEIISTDTTGANKASLGISRDVPDQPPERSSVILKRINDDWRIAYNFYLSNRLAGN